MTYTTYTVSTAKILYAIADSISYNVALSYVNELFNGDVGIKRNGNMTTFTNGGNVVAVYTEDDGVLMSAA